ncbi:MAG: hypothetical protein ABIS50_19870 [Luteolibacter sp.]|uniref:hypothetical protein n=1 Tax=Luteolibacter sp. TaxID=1962973 RepID=UPI0032652625
MKLFPILALILMGMSVSNADDNKGPPVEEIGTIKEPMAVTKSRLIGLTENQILKLMRISKLESENKAENKRSFPSGHSSIPGLGGYVYTRYNLLTFRDGKVVQHELIDRLSACVITEPRAE